MRLTVNILRLHEILKLSYEERVAQHQKKIDCLLELENIVDCFGIECFVISVGDLIRSKKELGRHRDLAVVEELEELKNK